MDLNHLSHTFHALSDPTRLQIIELLLGGERCVCELTDSLAAAQSRLSFHLRVLKDAGLVTDRKEGRWVYYTLDSAALEDAAAFLGELPNAKDSWTVKIARSRKAAVRVATPCCS